MSETTYEDGRIFDKASTPIELFCADTLQPRSAYTKIMKHRDNHPELKKLMSLCVGMCLSADLSVLLFQSAGRTLIWDKESMAYRYILTHMRGRFIEEVNVFLEDLGLGLIGASTNTAKE